ncbi:MAG: lytic transglycosylase domain-containing protein [Candidatus Omnitrophica bacterium]|nr:lytic transglycosylase domain-containing protein [Candidatus Omnitrophota bacterium]
MKRFSYCSRFIATTFLASFLSGAAWGAVPKEYDLVCMESGNLIEGSILIETNLLITLETLGGSVSVPIQSVKKVVRARPGESALLLGLTFLERRNLSKAEQFLNKASAYLDWREASKEGLQRLEEYKNEEREKQKLREQEEIERLIQRRGLQAGINVLEKRYKNAEDDFEDEYWGSYRGKLHLMRAQDRIDHLDLGEAERQLALAEKFGVNQKEWEAVRKELLDARRESVLLGPNALASRRFSAKKTKALDIGSSFLAAVKKAQQRGEKVPPLELLHMVDRYAKMNELDPLLVCAMIDTESSWRKDVVSSKGAQGLMQLMPMTAQELDVSDPFNPEENIKGGTSYMRFLLTLFDDLDTALAAYNVGPGRVERSGIPPAGKRYIDKVRKRIATLQKQFGRVAASS